MSDTTKSGTAAAVSPPASIFRAAEAPFEVVGGAPHFEMREFDLAAATSGGYTVRVFRASGEGGAVAPMPHWHDADFQYVHILSGEIEFQLVGGERHRLRAGDAIYQPRGCVHCVTWISADLELLEIFSPARITTVGAAG